MTKLTSPARPRLGKPVDTTLYMALPAALFLGAPALLVTHPTDWPGVGNASLTDLEVLAKVWELSPAAMSMVLLSGLFAAMYNLLQYWVVQALSASHAAFAGNFNKAATIGLSICLGLEQLPDGVWASAMVGAVCGNILAFGGYSLLKAREAPPADEAAPKPRKA